MAGKPTRPLKVTARLLDGRFYSSDGIVMLDGILYHAWFCKHHPEALETGQWMVHGRGFIGLPVRHLPGNRWMASRGIYTELSQMVEHRNKRPDFFAADKGDCLAMDQGLISDRVGAFRAYRMPCIIRTVKDGILDFYCVGNRVKILDLLSYVPAIGKKPAAGWGLVANWEIEEIEEDYSFMHPQHGLMRPTPVDETALEGYPIMDYAVKPPYWKPCNFRRCYVPMEI